MSWFANFVYLIGAVIYLPVLVYQMVFQGKNRRGWGEKFRGPRASIGRVNGASRGCVWVHGVSLGEVNATRRLVDGLEARWPDSRVLISTTTDTGYARACQLYGEDRVFRYPLDFSWTVRRALRIIQPDLIVLIEQEVWFNLVTIARKQGIPVCVVNGRLTERSQRRLRMLGPLSHRMFSSLHWVGVQDDATAERFTSVGVPPERIDVTGSVKWDTALVAERIDGQDALAAAVGIDPSRPLWVCGSTGHGEESMLLDAYEHVRRDLPQLQLAIIPRKPERFDEVDALIQRRGFLSVRRKHSPDGTVVAAAPADRVTVVLGDTMGELRKFYALATVVFVGRSLVPMGGSDPMEAAALGKPVLVGPFMDNFAEPTRKLEEGEGLAQVKDTQHLADEVARLVRHPEAATGMGHAGQRVVIDNQGATDRTVAMLGRMLEEDRFRADSQS